MSTSQRPRSIAPGVRGRSASSDAAAGGEIAGHDWWTRLAFGLACWVTLLAGAAPGLAGTTPDAREIVARADRIRFPADPFQVDIAITTTRAGRPGEVRQLRVLARGNQRAMVMTLSPAEDRGQILLMRDDDLWLFVPAVAQPVRLPLSQRLTGQVSNGDVARANLGGDYDPTILRTEQVDGVDHYVIELVAARKGVTYDRVLYWVNQENFRPHKAEFYTRSKRLVKTCEYREYRPLGGEVRPTRLVMRDALRSGDHSVLDYSSLQMRDLPEMVFTKDYLKKLQ